MLLWAIVINHSNFNRPKSGNVKENERFEDVQGHCRAMIAAGSV